VLEWGRFLFCCCIVFELAFVAFWWQGLQTICQQSPGTNTAVPSQKDEERQEEQQATCDPNKAIPLHYHPLHEQRSSTTMSAGATLPPDVDLPACTGHTHSAHCSDVLLCSPASSAVTWQVQLKALLLRKACIVCYKLAREQLAAQMYGVALNFARQAFYCFGMFFPLNWDALTLWGLTTNSCRKESSK